MALEHEALTQVIIGAAIEVHRRLGPGFLESIYRNALVIELRKRGLHVRAEVDVPVFYDEQEVGRHRVDLFVEDTILVELKAIQDFQNVHFVIARSYLKAMGRKHGLLFNFAKVTLQIRRVIFDAAFREECAIGEGSSDE